MKKRLLYISVAIFALFIMPVLCTYTAFDHPTIYNGYFEGYSKDRVVSRVYKHELTTQVKNEEIAKILVERRMNKYLPGNIGWTKWVWAYEIKKINISEDDLPYVFTVEIYVKPLIAYYWRDFWTFEVNRVEGGWVRVIYLMVINDKGDYYELRGPYSGA